MRLVKVLPAALAIAGLAAAALAQQDAVFKSGVDVVSLLATVRDSRGQLVNDLTKEDFILKEDGKLQTIRYFERQADLPLTVGLLVDTSLSQRRILEQERSAGSEFFSRVVDETKDQAFVLSFDFEVKLLQDLTNSKALLQRGLQDLELPEGRVYRTGPVRPLEWSSQAPSGRPSQRQSQWGVGFMRSGEEGIGARPVGWRSAFSFNPPLAKLASPLVRGANQPPARNARSPLVRGAAP